jgi:hypothetical protein
MHKLVEVHMGNQGHKSVSGVSGGDVAQGGVLKCGYTGVDGSTG